MKKLISRAPLRISLAGGGTDQEFFYKDYLGHVLSTTIGLYAYTEIQKSDKVILSATDLNKSIVVKDLNAPPKELELMLLYFTYKKICEKYNDGKLLLVNVNTFSEVSLGSGLGASSALVVSMIYGFSEYLNLSLNSSGSLNSSLLLIATRNLADLDLGFFFTSAAEAFIVLFL